MKHLKTYEELKSEVYRRAANKLSKLGHQGRANTLKDWSYKVEKDEEMVSGKKTYKNIHHSENSNLMLLIQKQMGGYQRISI